jgi:hypothetical protein
LAKSREEIQKLRSENAKLYQQFLESGRPPLDVFKRASISGIGEVIRIQNLTPQVLPVKIKLENAFGTTKDYELVLPAAKITGGIKEIGHLEGWTAAPGDKITIKPAGHPEIKKSIGLK